MQNHSIFCTLCAVISELHSLLFPPRNLWLHLLLYSAIPPTAHWAVTALLSLHHIKPRITEFLTIPEGATSTGAPFRLSRITLLALPDKAAARGLDTRGKGSPCSRRSSPHAAGPRSHPATWRPQQERSRRRSPLSAAPPGGAPGPAAASLSLP